MVLLVVDTQKLLVNEELYNFKEFVSNIEALIHMARKNNVQVIYVVHDEGIGTDLTKGKSGFEHGFNIIVPTAANSTTDNKFLSGENSHKYYNEYMWPNRYAKCISMEDIFNLIEGI